MQLQTSERQRQDTYDLLQLVLDNTTESLWQIDAQALTIELSERFVRRFGLGASLITLSEFNQRVHPDDVERLRELWPTLHRAVDYVRSLHEEACQLPEDAPVGTPFPDYAGRDGWREHLRDARGLVALPPAIFQP